MYASQESRKKNTHCAWFSSSKKQNGLASNIPDKTGMQAEGQAEPGHAGDAHSMSSLECMVAQVMHGGHSLSPQCRMLWHIPLHRTLVGHRPSVLHAR